MKRLLIIVGAGALLVGLGGERALAQATATANVWLTIQPYAKVTLDSTSVEIIIPGGATYYGPVYVGGTVVCNCSTTLFTRIAKPDGAPGDWYSYPVSEIKQPGQGHDPQLLRIMVLSIPQPFGGWTCTLNVSGESVQDPGQVGTPAPGEVILTVVPG